MIKAKIIGAGGYGGAGITELLLGHPDAEAAVLVDVENAGMPIDELYPHLKGFTDLVILDPSDSKAVEASDVVFMATPDGVGMKLAASELEKGAKVIDYSGDFRFNSTDSYSEYAAKIGIKTQHAEPDLLSGAVYGLPELHRSDISTDVNVIGNPGCFAVSCILGLAPAVKAGAIEEDGIICDCKTGVSGAGKNPAATFHYPARHDNMNAYKLAGHQHVCEIERELGLLAGNDIKLTFTSQIVPVCRGIMSSLYGKCAQDMKEGDLLEIYKNFYKDDVFVRVYDSSASVGTVHVRGTNYCNIVVSIDDRTGTMRVVSYIDNLVKGQAGSAMQNMNLIFGLEESAGLDSPGVYP